MMLADEQRKGDQVCHIFIFFDVVNTKIIMMGDKLKIETSVRIYYNNNCYELIVGKFINILY